VIRLFDFFDFGPFDFGLTTSIFSFLRVPLVEANFEEGTTIPSYQYHIENMRPYDVRVVIHFSGENFKVAPANGLFNQPAHHIVEGVIGWDLVLPCLLISVFLPFLTFPSSAFLFPLSLSPAAKGLNTAFALIDAQNRSKDFSFASDIKIYPVHDDVRETNLEGKPKSSASLAPPHPLSSVCLLPPL